MKKDTSALETELEQIQNLDFFLEENRNEFETASVSDYLNELLAKYQLSCAEVIKRAQAKETYAYQIFTGLKPNPGREKLIQLAFGFPLTVKELERLLKIAGYAGLYPRRTREAVLMYGLQKKMDCAGMNDYLFEKGFSTMDWSK